MSKGATTERGQDRATTAAVPGAHHVGCARPVRGCANALRDSLSDAVQVLDAFHVVKLGTQVVDEVRRRVQQEQLGRRGHRDDPLYEIRGPLRHGLEHLTERQHARLQAGLLVGDPSGEVELAWSCYQQLRPSTPARRSIHWPSTRQASRGLTGSCCCISTGSDEDADQGQRRARGWPTTHLEAP
jgi:Transposase